MAISGNRVWKVNSISSQGPVSQPAPRRATCPTRALTALGPLPALPLPLSLSMDTFFSLGCFLKESLYHCLVTNLVTWLYPLYYFKKLSYSIIFNNCPCTTETTPRASKGLPLWGLREHPPPPPRTRSHALNPARTLAPRTSAPLDEVGGFTQASEGCSLRQSISVSVWGPHPGLRPGGAMGR